MTMLFENICYFLKINFNIIIPHSPRSYQLSLSSVFSDWSSTGISILSHSPAHITSKTTEQAQFYRWYLGLNLSTLVYPCHCVGNSEASSFGREEKGTWLRRGFITVGRISAETPNRVLSLVGQVSAVSGLACNGDTIWAGSWAPYLNGQATNE